MNGKGSTSRPMYISREEWDKNWKKAFGKQKFKAKKPKLKNKQS